MSNLRQKLHDILGNPFVESDEELNGLVIQALYDENKSQLSRILADLQQKERNELEKQVNGVVHALDRSVGNFCHVSRLLLDNKTSHKSKGFLNEIYGDDGWGVPYLIDICKNLYPNCSAEYGSNNDRWFFEKFKDTLMPVIDEFLEGGDSYDWAKSFGHIDYIKKMNERYGKGEDNIS
jgi:hypothetical protein